MRPAERAPPSPGDGRGTLATDGDTPQRRAGARRPAHRARRPQPARNRAVRDARPGRDRRDRSQGGRRRSGLRAGTDPSSSTRSRAPLPTGARSAEAASWRRSSAASRSRSTTRMRCSPSWPGRTGRCCSGTWTPTRTHRIAAFAAALGVRDFVGTPLLTQGRSVGILAVDDRRAGRGVGGGRWPGAAHGRQPHRGRARVVTAVRRAGSAEPGPRGAGRGADAGPRAGDERGTGRADRGGGGERGQVDLPVQRLARAADPAHLDRRVREARPEAARRRRSSR